jgi:hypothetical protein
MFSVVLLAASLVSQADAPPLATQRLEAVNSKLLAAVERLEARVAELEKRLSEKPVSGLPHGASLDPEAQAYSGGRWVHHPDTDQVVFAESEWQRRKGAGGSMILELIRHKGKPVALPSVTWGAHQSPKVAEPPRPAPAAQLSIPLPTAN